MSISPRSISKDGTVTKSSNTIGSAIKELRNINRQSDPARDDIGKTLKDINSIAKVMKDYVTRSKDSNNDGLGKGKLQHQGNQLNKMYSSVYKGTYEGIIDGLKKVSDDQRTEELKSERIEATKSILKTTAKVAVSAPAAITKALINLFAFERSEVLNAVRALYHGVGYGGSKVDYQQKAFRMMLDQEHERKKLLKKGNVLTQNETIIELLTRIGDTSEEQSKRDRIFGLQKFIGQKDSVQIELLKEIEVNTGGAAQGLVSMRRSVLKFIPMITAGLPLAISSMAGAINPMGAVIGGAVGGLAMVITKRFRSVSNEQMFIMKDQLESLRKIEENTKDTQDAGFFGLGKTYENQNEILRDIRTAVSPKEQEKSGLAKMWHTFTKVPISDLFKESADLQQTDAERTVELLEQQSLEIEHNTDYLEGIFKNTKDIRKFNNQELVLSKDLLKKTDTGVVVIPSSSTIYTPFEQENIKELKNITDENYEERKAIVHLGGKLCECLGSNNLNSGSELTKIMGSNRQDNLERSMDDQEERKDYLNAQLSLQRSVDAILGVMQQQDPLQKIKEGGGIIKNLGKVADGIDAVGDILDIKEALVVQKVAYADNKQVVSLSKETLDAMCECFNDDDGFDLPSRGRRKSRAKGASKGISKGASKSAGKGAGKGVAKFLGKSVLKKLPVIGLLAGLGFAGSALIKGDVIGAGLETLSGISSMFVGPGTVASMGIDAISAGRDTIASTLSPSEASASVVAKDTSALTNELIKPTGLLAETASLVKIIKENIIKSAEEFDFSKASQYMDKGIQVTGEALAGTKEAIDAVKGSATAGALRQSVSEVVTAVGGSQTNITLPVQAHDTDRSTNLLVHSLGA